MANIKSNEKRLHQDKKKKLLNHSQKSELRTQIKKARLTQTKEDLSKSYKLIDKSVTKKIITKNKANRLKSRLTIGIAADK